MKKKGKRQSKNTRKSTHHILKLWGSQQPIFMLLFLPLFLNSNTHVKFLLWIGKKIYQKDCLETVATKVLEKNMRCCTFEIRKTVLLIYIYIYYMAKGDQPLTILDTLLNI